MFHFGKPIWWTEQQASDEYMQMQGSLRADLSSGPVMLRIAADSDYTVYLNGSVAAFGQFQSYPDRRVYDDIDVTRFLRDGENDLQILVWHYGIQSSTTIKGVPFLIFEFTQDGKSLCASDETTQVRLAPGYVSHLNRLITQQLGLAYAYDFGAKGGEYVPAQVVEVPSCQWLPRPVKKLLLKERMLPTLVQQGSFRMDNYPGNPWTSPETDMQHAALSFRCLKDISGQTSRTLNAPKTLAVRDGSVYFIVDLGEETVGFLDFDLEVPADCDMEVGYGEHLHDGRCRTAVRNFTASFRLKKGRNRFFNTFRRFGCRYLQFFVFCPNVTVHYAGLRPTPYPVTFKNYQSSNLLRDTIYKIAQNTLLHCMHEHYEDCPWREQALYAMDSRNQMLCGYYAFGETRFPRASLELISYGQRSDGLLSLCYPAGKDKPIPSFSLIWFIAMNEYIQYSGDTTLARERLGVLESVLDAFRKNATDEGLLKSFIGYKNQYWNFYEWTESMDGKYDTTLSVPEAPLNAFYSLALQNMAEICKTLGEPYQAYLDKAARINRLLTEHFFDPERGLYISFPDRAQDRYSVLTNALCLLCGAADEVDTTRILEVLACNGQGFADCIPDSLSMQCFRFDALLRTDKARFAPMILSELDNTCLHMLRNGATTFWETIDGEAAFADAGSLCHGWSALVIYYYETLCKE